MPTGMNGIVHQADQRAPSSPAIEPEPVAQLRRDHRHEAGREGGVEAERLGVDRRAGSAPTSVPRFQNT